ncbi:NAD(P)H-binding protein [Streptomyces sp. NPDC006296]|uniref:NAD-dependent epimerase/dehydratase family protein n=1 Tax=Streptomyces sp. NPDC006296 TaxID=3156746 RepID=UPI0033A12C24
MTGVLITGGTGKTGSALARSLRASGVPIRVASRSPSADARDATRFDWSEPTTHAAALRGMDRVYLVPPVDTTDPMPLVEPFLAEAERLGVRRLVLLGSAIVLPGAPSALELAAHVRARPGWAVLRPSGFMQNFLPPHPLGEQIRRQGEIRTAAGTGRVGWIDARDIAAAAAALLTGPDHRPDDARDHLLTGPEALSYGDAAQIISRRTGRPVRTVPVEAAEQAYTYRASGMPDAFATALAAVDAGIRTGREDRVSSAVLDLTGRPPRTFADFVQDHLARWTSSGTP